MIGDYEPAAIKTIPPAALANVEIKYQALVKNGRLPRNSAFEAELGMRLQ